MKTIITVQGTHCHSCQMLINDIAKDLGASSTTVDIKTGKTIIEHTGVFDVKKFKREIESIGEYKVV